RVTLRGLPISPEEIEAALRRHPDVSDAVVVVRDASGTRERGLAAFVAARGGRLPVAAALQRALGEQLPELVIPTTVTLLAALPRSATGAVDRRALSALA